MSPERVISFTSLLQAFFSIYGQNRVILPEVNAIWYNALLPYDLKDIYQAFMDYVSDSERGMYPPKPADIIRALEIRQVTDSASAWRCVEQAIRKSGMSRSVEFDDPIVPLVIKRMGGWAHLCRIPDEKKLSQAGREFCEQYRKIKNSPPILPSEISRITRE
jgi:hypothetical protein